MKTKKILGLAAVAFGLVGMTACGGNSGSKAPAKGSSSKHTHKYETVKEGTHVDASCKAAGKETKVCACGAEKEFTIPQLDHTVVEDASKDVAATCENPGKVGKKCSVCGTDLSEETQALGHQWVNDDVQDGDAATCTTAGKVKQHCSRQGCDGTREQEVAALGHEFTKDDHKTEIPATAEGIAMTKATCDRDDAVRLIWKAGDTTEATKTEKVNVTDPSNADAEKIAPRIVGDDENGYQFWGRPIGNGGVLNESGNATEDAQAEDALQSVEGDYFEFKLNLPEAIEGYSLLCDAKPGNYTSDMFAVGSEADWTKGFKFAADGTASAIDDFRYILTIDGTKVDWDKSTYEAQRAQGSQQNMTRAWYKLPGSYTLAKGKHTLRLTMAGGYKASFFNFAFEKAGEVPGGESGGSSEINHKFNEHEFVDGACACGATKFSFNALDTETYHYTLASGSTNGKASAGHFKLASNGQYATWEFDYTGAKKTGLLCMEGYMDNWGPNGANRGKSYYSGNKTATTNADKIGNFELKLNDAAVDFSAYKTNTYADWFGLGATDSLSALSLAPVGQVTLANHNTMKFTRIDSYNVEIENFVVIFEK